MVQRGIDPGTQNTLMIIKFPSLHSPLFCADQASSDSDSDRGFSGGREYGGKEYYEPGMSDFEFGDMTDSFSTRR